uniref:Minichromosome loss protein Mcl1 middle region domain-containing protein n=1 Tax=Setaria digitata TaxID=48799 RepID=A0A915Q7P5_9BILA
MMYSGEFAEPRLLHSKGFIQLCIDKSGADNTGSFLSVGTDGDVWIWTGDELDEAEYNPKSIKERTHCAVAWHENDVYIGHTSTDGQSGIQKPTVSRFAKDSMRMIAPITTFSLDLSSIDVSKSGKFLAAGAVDHVLKIINLGTGEIFRAEADGQIMCVSFDPEDEYLAVTATDGLLRVFALTLSRGEVPQPICVRICSRILDIEPSNSRLQLCWNPSGSNLFVPALGCIKKFSKDSFKETNKFLPASNSYEMFSICCVSSCGTYLASSTMSGSIYVWQIATGDLLSCSNYQINGQSKVICTMFWHSRLQDTLFFADIEEHICSLSKCAKRVISDKCNKIDLDLESRGSKTVEKFDDDENSQLSADLGAIKKSYGFDKEGYFHGGTVESTRDPDLFTTKESPFSYKPVVVPKAFVTGSTPEHWKQRYLKWNRYGTVISSYNGVNSRIEINWHDASIHPEIIVDNAANFSVADMTDEMVALASKADGESLSELQVHCIKAWDYGSRQWNVTLPKNESVENIAVGKTFLLLATSQRYFRTFSHAGTQKMIFCYSGPLLTICAFNDMFTAVVLKGGAYYEDDEPQFDVYFSTNIYKMKTEGLHKCQSLIQTVPVSVSRNAKLDWIGYTNRGTLCAMDSKYCCRILSSNGIWIPIYDFSCNLISKSDHIFLISFMDYPQCEVRYIYCRGMAYPLVESRLVPTIAKWQLPLCNQDSEKSKLEEKLLLAEIRKCVLDNDDEVEQQSELVDISTAYAKDVVRLFALACKADRQCRAAEFAAYTHSGQVVQSMCNFASKTRHPLLAEKVAEAGRTNIAQQTMNRDGHERKRNVIVDDSKKNDFLAPKRWRKVDDNQTESSLDRVFIKPLQKELEQKENEHEHELESTLDDESSSVLLFPVEQKLPSNPFKRKSQNTFDSSKDSFFDSLASASSTVKRKGNVDSSNRKKMKTEPSKARQTLLSVKLADKKKAGEAKTGFKLWLEAMGNKLREDYNEDEDFTEYAIRMFRRLKTEEKQVGRGFFLSY